MSGLWTPGGGQPPHGDAPSVGSPVAPGASGEPGTASPEEEAMAREQLRQLREQLANTPVADIIANHVIGLWELAVLHLTPDEGRAPDLEQAGLAIDAIGAIVDGLGGRLGPNAEPLRDALAQLRLAYVEVSRPDAPGTDT